MKMLALAAVAALAVAASAAAQYPPGYPAGPGMTPGLSPYLNLLNRNNPAVASFIRKDSRTSFLSIAKSARSSGRPTASATYLRMQQQTEPSAG